MKYLALILSICLLGCERSVSNGEVANLKMSKECKLSGTFADYRFCKYTNKNDMSVCAKVGDGAFTIPCEFYDGL